MLELAFACAGVDCDRFAVAPTLVFDVRITEEGMVDAIFGEGRDGRPYIKGFTVRSLGRWGFATMS